ncbi:MAG TPA: Arc family DNA-binding protein [Acetobacteraceae bacterium]|nr:Arc family DNA-binding protein [Acetobacteraceae bacterium]
MPADTLTVRKIGAGLKEQLRIRAARHGRSMEAEVRAILEKALAQENETGNLADAIRRRFAPLGGVELEPHPPVPIDEPPSFDR